MLDDNKLIRSTIQKLLEQSETGHRLKRDLVKCTMRLILEEDTHVPDTLTRIRILPLVSVVAQRDKVVRPEHANAVLVLYVKFLPRVNMTTYQNLKSLATMIKGLPGVKVVSILSIDGKIVTHKGQKIVI